MRDLSRDIVTHLTAKLRCRMTLMLPLASVTYSTDSGKSMCAPCK